MLFLLKKSIFLLLIMIFSFSCSYKNMDFLKKSQEIHEDFLSTFAYYFSLSMVKDEYGKYKEVIYLSNDIRSERALKKLKADADYLFKKGYSDDAFLVRYVFLLYLTGDNATAERISKKYAIDYKKILKIVH